MQRPQLTLSQDSPAIGLVIDTGQRIERLGHAPQLADRMTTAPGLASTRQTFAARCPEIRATTPFTTQVRQSVEVPFHGEPRQREHRAN
jgi:hypothetical protein